MFHTNTMFHVCWLRESSAGHLDSDLGTAVPAQRLELALMGLSAGTAAGNNENGGSMPHLTHNLEVSHIMGALQSLDRVQSLPKWLGWRLNTFFGPLTNAQRVSQARENFAILSGACDRIRHAAGNQPWIELHLPYFDRRDWNARFQILRAMKFGTRHGWIQSLDGGSDPLSLQEIVLRVSAGVFQPRAEQGLPLRFLCKRNLPQPWASGLASRWGFAGLPQDCHIRSIDIRLPAQAVEGWRMSPRLHHGRYHVVWARVALAVQWILRRWNVALQFSTPDGIEDFEASCHALLFNCIRPWAENVRSELYYDVLDETLMQTAFRKAGQRLESALETVAERLSTCGNSAIAAQYRGEDAELHAARIADRGLRGKAVRGMLAAETGIINALMRYSQDVKAAESPRAIRHATAALQISFNEFLPRIFRRNVLDHIGSAIFLEATAAMHTALGGEPAMDVRLETSDGARRHNLRMPLSDAA